MLAVVKVKGNGAENFNNEDFPLLRGFIIILKLLLALCCRLMRPHGDMCGEDWRVCVG